MDLRLGFLASHGGSNVEAILNNIENGSLEAEAEVVICNNPGARVLSVAQERSVDNIVINENLYGDKIDSVMIRMFKDHSVNLVVVAGYMKQIGKNVIGTYRNRILNIHPSLLPKYGGKGMFGDVVHRAVIDSDDVESGATVHLITPKYDEGEIVGQCRVDRHSTDSVESLSSRVLRFEHILYSQVLRDIQMGIIDLDLVGG